MLRDGSHFISDFDQEARRQDQRVNVDRCGRFPTASGLAFAQEAKVWMFDNEIDWVKRVGIAPRAQWSPRGAREAMVQIPMALEYKAEHKQLSREQVRSDSGKLRT